jgi:ferritin-like metal-binding protein YciE
MNVDSFRDMYIAELQELRSVEEQLVGALPKMADMASHAELKQAIRSGGNPCTASPPRCDPDPARCRAS